MTRGLFAIWLLGTVLWSVVLLAPSIADAQTCEPPRKCVSGDDVNAAADALCRRARAAEERLGNPDDPQPGTCLNDLRLAERASAEHYGEARTLERQLSLVESVEPPWRPPLWLRLALDVGIGLTAAATGTVAAVGGPPEFVAGLAVGSVAVLVSRIVLEVLR